MKLTDNQDNRCGSLLKRKNMKNKLKLLTAIIACVVIAAAAGCGARQFAEHENHQSNEQEAHKSHEHGTAADGPAVAAANDYILKYEWPEKPKVGTYTLKVSLTDGSGAPVEGAEVVVSYDMPSMRGAHATTETMKKNARGDYLLPIRFVMPGDWEIVVSAVKDGVEIATELILLDI